MVLQHLHTNELSEQANEPSPRQITIRPYPFVPLIRHKIVSSSNRLQWFQLEYLLLFL
jgi:hypothetical protein